MILNPRRIGESFGDAARSYDQAAQLQRQVATDLAELIVADQETSPGLILDVGCGTGEMARQLSHHWPTSQCVGLDLALGMALHARSTSPMTRLLVGDAERLPIASNSVDLLVSSMAIQWCRDPKQVFAEFHRVLKPGGRLAVTTLGPETLSELKNSWASVEPESQHVNNFTSESELNEALAATCEGFELHRRCYLPSYPDAVSVMRNLKSIGAQTVLGQRKSHLTGRKKLVAMMRHYEKNYQTEEGDVTATYELFFIQVKKVGCR